MWAYPREQSAKEKMRMCYDDVLANTKNLGQDRANKLTARLQEEFSSDIRYKEFCNVISEEEALEIENWLLGLQDDDESSEIVEYE
jgi:hypothetical protein